MARGALRAVVCTSTLDLGIDWGDVDLVIQLASPKGAVAHGPADRPRQPPPGRAQPRPLRAGQPLRDAGVPGRARGDRRERPRHRAVARPARSTCWPSTSWACACSEPFDLVALYDEVRTRRALPRPRLGGLRGGGRFRRHRRLRAARLRPLRPHREGPGRPLAGAQRGDGPAPSAERRRHRLAGHAERARRRGPARRRPGARSARWRRATSRCWSPATPSSSPASVWRLVGVTGLDVLVTPAAGEEAKMPSWGGSKFALSTFLARQRARR